MKKSIPLILLFFAFNAALFAQEDVQIGQTLKKFEQYQRGALYDYSNPDAINIKVHVWGYVQFPGQYIIPSTSTIDDLLSLAGGPTQDAGLEDLRIFRRTSDSDQTMIKFDYNDLLWNERLTKKINIPDLEAGDILLIPGSPRFFLKDYLGITLSIVSTLASIAVLLITIFRK
jgi:SLBB domain